MWQQNSALIHFASFDMVQCHGGVCWCGTRHTATTTVLELVTEISFLSDVVGDGATQKRISSCL
jgi:hypothetical protein